jgi:8-oxo-dGTP pyrophosphatase MutT (NUDIX family)
MSKLNESSVRAIPADAHRGWEVRVANGDSVRPPQLTLRQPGLGVTVAYGWTPGGFDGVVIRQDRGGVVIVPFVEMGSQLYIGVVEQKRSLQQREGVVLNVPRGFRGDEEAMKGARRELVEEVGISPDLIIELGGQPTNPNSTFFDTSGGDEQGDRYFGVWLTPDQVVLEADVYRLRPDLIHENKAHRVAECIGRCRFIPWEQAIDLADTFTVVAAARVSKYVKAVYAAQK